jgi:Fur family ferric uptake transcriptional regulator
MDPLLFFRQTIKSRGLRETSQREGVLIFFVEAKGHLSQEDIFKGVRSRQQSIGRATVFRTVKLLEEIGLVPGSPLPMGFLDMNTLWGDVIMII